MLGMQIVLAAVRLVTQAIQETLEEQQAAVQVVDQTITTMTMIAM